MDLCPPVLTYGAFMIALGLYNIYMGSFPSLARTLFYLIVGGILLWILCAARMEFVAWSILGIPVIFYVFLFAILIFHTGFDIQSEKVQRCKKALPPTVAPCAEEEQVEECEPQETQETQECSD